MWLVAAGLPPRPRQPLLPADGPYGRLPNALAHLGWVWGLPPDAFVILTVGPVGRLSHKRLDVLAAEVAQAPGAFLVSAGGDEDGAAEVKAAARAALGDRFRPLGQVARERIPSLHAAADVYSLGSLGEPFSIAILEAMATGRPVVHHHDPVMRWQTGVGGIAVSMESPGVAGAVFRELAMAPARTADLGAAARRLAEERYSPRAVCAELVAAWNDILARVGGGGG